MIFSNTKNFWLPILILLVFFILTESLLRLGFYDNWVKPKSYLGNALYRSQALAKQGLDKFDWIVVGSSRVDWGLNHKKVFDMMSSSGIRYGRMSFESSNFTAIQATTDWSIQNLNSIDGVILGVSENELSHLNDLSKQYKVAWPFRGFIDFDNYQSIFKKLRWTKYIYSLAWTTYFQDIKAFLRNPILRNEQIQSAKPYYPMTFVRRNNENLCGIPLKTLKQCVYFANQDKLPSNNKLGFRLIKKICSQPAVVARANSNNHKSMSISIRREQLVSNWTNFINSALKANKQFVLLLLPEHETHDYIIKPSNADKITDKIISNVSNHKNFQLIDLRNALELKQNCEFFSDPSHFNDKGIELVTNEFIKEFNLLNLQ